LPIEENDYFLYAPRCKNTKVKRLVMQKSMGTDDVFKGIKRAVYWVVKIIKGKVKFSKFLQLQERSIIKKSYFSSKLNLIFK
tara:strand:+ start:408 stop:653 length:246 start_codon:yes stop_codon:yes gene_type:complete